VTPSQVRDREAARLRRRKERRPLATPIHRLALDAPDAAGGAMWLRDAMIRAAGRDPAEFPIEKYPDLFTGGA
jgi:hypothetical protein